MGMQNGAATLEIVQQLLKKLKIELPYDPAIPTPRYTSEGTS